MSASTSQLCSSSTAAANSTLSSVPNSRNEKISRLLRRRRYFIRSHQAVANPVSCVDHGLPERFVYGRAQRVNMHSQAVAVGQLLTPNVKLKFAQIGRASCRERMEEEAVERGV